MENPLYVLGSQKHFQDSKVTIEKMPLFGEASFVCLYIDVGILLKSEKAGVLSLGLSSVVYRRSKARARFHHFEEQRTGRDALPPRIVSCFCFKLNTPLQNPTFPSIMTCAVLGCSQAARQGTLDPPSLVRIQPPQPFPLYQRVCASGEPLLRR